MKRKTHLIIIAIAALAALAVAYLALRDPGAEAEEPKVGTPKEIAEAIRSDLGGTRSQCDEGPPSAEERASWRGQHEPTQLKHTPMSQLVRRTDSELDIEIASRLLDELYDTGYGQMTPRERDVYLVQQLESEVNNGGFHQFFLNSSGNCALQTRAAVAAIGSPVLKSLYDKALAVFPGSAPSEDRAERNRQMEALEDEWTAWEKLDDEFFETSASAQIAAYVRQHAGEFSPPAWYGDGGR